MRQAEIRVFWSFVEETGEPILYLPYCDTALFVMLVGYQKAPTVRVIDIQWDMTCMASSISHYDVRPVTLCFPFCPLRLQVTFSILFSVPLT